MTTSKPISKNLRAVWERAVHQRDYETLDQMTEGFFWFRNFRGLYQNVFQFGWDQLKPTDDQEPHPVAMKILIRIAEFREVSDQVIIERALESARKYADEQEIAFCNLLWSWYLIDHTERVTEGRHFVERLLANSRNVDDVFFVAEFHYAIGTAFKREGEFDLAVGYLKQTFDLHTKSGNMIMGAWALSVLGDISFDNGHYAKAEDYYRRVPNLLQNAGGYPHGESINKSDLSLLAIRQFKLEQATALAEEALQIALDHNYIHKAGFAWDRLVWIAFLKQDYARAEQLHKENVSFLELPLWPQWPLAYGDWRGSLIACGLERFDDAREQIQRALRYWAVESSELGKIIQCLPVYAAILANDGSHVRAAELLALAFNHPTNADDWMAKWPLLINLRDNLYHQLGEEAYESAWKRGASLELSAVVADLLDTPQAIHETPQYRANQELPEPLSHRELEILQYLTDRRTNQEIADELFISEGTVKTHTNKIYAKAFCELSQ